MRVQEIAKLPEKWKLVAIRPYSTLEFDDYLAVVLAILPDDGQYATWVYNYTTFGCHHGHYFGKDNKTAFSDFLERSVYKPKPGLKTKTEGFTCLKCNSHCLEEIMSGVNVSSMILGVHEGSNIEYGRTSNKDGEIECYRCIDCGLEIVGVRDPIGLFLYLKKEKKNG